MIMGPIKEALTFDDVILAPNYSNILPSEVDTKTVLSKKFNIRNTTFIVSHGYCDRI